MARTRNIRPGFFSNELLGDLHPLTRLLFAGTWTLADREGRLLDRPKKIKAEVLPYDNHNPDKALAQLADCGFIIRYEVDGERYIQVANWRKHQHPHPREEVSKIRPPEGYASDAGANPGDSIQDDESRPLGAPPDTDPAGLVAFPSRSFNAPNGAETPPTPPDEQGGQQTRRRTRRRSEPEPKTPRRVSPEDAMQLGCSDHADHWTAGCDSCVSRRDASIAASRDFLQAVLNGSHR